MAQTQLIVHGVTSLEEARYFAAMGADWIGFQADGLPLERIRSISSWVVGPRTFIEFESAGEDDLFQADQQLQPDGMMLPAGEFPPWYQGVRIHRGATPEGHLPDTDISYGPSGTVSDAADFKHLWLSIDTAHFQEALQALPAAPLGIVITCTGTGDAIDFDVYDNIIGTYQDWLRH